MSLPRDYEKEMNEMMIMFRAKCSELNLVNSEMNAAEIDRKRRYDAYYKLYQEYQDWHERELQPLGAKLVEIRSELQAMQATMLDLLIEFQLRGHS
jgi:hypothetical protein